MTEGLADARNRATARHVTLYRRWAEGGAGLLLTGNVQVDRRYLERGGNIVIDGPQEASQLAALEAMAEAGATGGTHLWMQPCRTTDTRTNRVRARGPIRRRGRITGWSLRQAKGAFRR